jgi:hypothetical protein
VEREVRRLPRFFAAFFIVHRFAWLGNPLRVEEIEEANHRLE